MYPTNLKEDDLLPSSKEISNPKPNEETVRRRTAKDERQAEILWKKVTKAELKCELLKNLKERGVATRKVEEFIGELNKDRLTKTKTARLNKSFGEPANKGDKVKRGDIKIKGAKGRTK